MRIEILNAVLPCVVCATVTSFGGLTVRESPDVYNALRADGMGLVPQPEKGALTIPFWRSILTSKGHPSRTAGGASILAICRAASQKISPPFTYIFPFAPQSPR